MPNYFVCPNCGEEVPEGALACPECGSDSNTGWSEDTLYDALDLPETTESEGWPPTGESSPFYQKKATRWFAFITLIVFLWFYIL